MKDHLKLLLERGVADGVFPGAQAAWCFGTEPMETAVAGFTDPDGTFPVTEDTVYDIASLTKLFTAAATLQLTESGAVPLNAPIGELALSARWKDSPIAAVTVAQLLAHESGLPDWRPFFEAVPPEDRGTSRGHRIIVEEALRTPLETAPGTRMVYSDVGFIALGALLTEICDQPLPQIIDTRVIRPLCLSTVHFRSETDNASPQGRFAATEACPWSGSTLRGTVHDDNARTMGGAAGHAGLFAGASDIARFGRAWLEALHGSGWLRAETAADAIERRPLGRGLGVDLKSRNGSSAGDIAGGRTFGHLGFTGCSLWVDPDAEAVLALLDEPGMSFADKRTPSNFPAAFSRCVFYGRAR